MLRKATLTDIETYGDFVYQFALDQTKSAYPTYTDGIKTREDFLRKSRENITREESDVWLYFAEGRMEGWLEYYWVSEDKFLQVDGCSINTGTKQALSELMAFLEEKFPGYELCFGFPKGNTEAVEFLMENGFSCIEDDHNTSFFFERYEPQEESKAVVKVTKENFEDFRKIHSQNEDDCYWTSDRILAAIDKWEIYVYYEKEQSVGSIFFNGAGTEYLEIFGVEFLDETYRKDVFMELMVAALNAGKRMGSKYLTFFCEEEMQEALQELGFVYVGSYVCYVKTI